VKNNTCAKILERAGELLAADEKIDYERPVNKITELYNDW
jgi:hypothetical protein